MQTPDKCFVNAGWTQSGDGQVIGFHGGSGDGWVVKNDSLGNFLWGKSIGGTDYDVCMCLTITPNAYIVGGYASTNDGDFDTVTHAVHSGHNIGFLAWLNPANGNIRRIKSYSGDMMGEIDDVKALSNGNLIVLGRMVQTGQVKNMWIAMLDSIGNIQWSKYYGTGSDTSNESPISITPKRYGGFIASAQTSSNTGDVHGRHGMEDIWLLNINDTGRVLWAKCYGGSFGQGPCGVFETSNNQLICAGITQSNDGDVTGFHGVTDFWVFKTDDTGRILWNRTIGGSGTDFMYSMQGTCDDGVVLGGHTNSTDGDVTGLNGPYDLFMVRLDSAGHIVWTRTYGSSGVDYEGRIITTSDNGYALIGFTGTVDYDVSGTLHGYGDNWFAKLSTDSLNNYCPPSSMVATNLDLIKSPNLYPNPVINDLFIENVEKGTVIKLFNIIGQQIQSITVENTSEHMKLENQAPGTYLLQLINPDGINSTKRIIKE